MEKQRQKELKEAYKLRHTTKGVAAWKSGDRLWIAKTDDATADFNGTSFQLRLGSWPNRELQQAYSAAPESFEWLLLKELKYEDPTQDYADDLELLLLECFDEYPDAKPMKPNQKRTVR